MQWIISDIGFEEVDKDLDWGVWPVSLFVERYGGWDGPEEVECYLLLGEYLDLNDYADAMKGLA